MMKEAVLAKATKSFRELKAERTNRLENWKLQLRMKLMEREKLHYDYTNFVEKKNILRQVEDIHRTTGYSPLSIKPDFDDKALKASPYFTSGQKLSEKSLSKWRNTEIILEKELRLSDIEVRKRQEQQKALLKLLVDLGVISEDSDVATVAAHQHLVPRATTARNKNNVKLMPLKQRPLTADVGSKHMLEENKKNRVSSAISRLGTEKEEDSSITSKQVKSELIASKARLNYRRESNLINEFGKIQRKNHRPSVQEMQMLKKEKSVAFNPPVTITVQDADHDVDDDEQVVIPAHALTSNIAMEAQPRWRRELRQEAPPGMQTPKGGVQVRLAISKSAMKKQLQEMVDTNEKDVNKLMRLEAERRERSRQSVLQTMTRIGDLGLGETGSYERPIGNTRPSSARILNLHPDSDSDDDY